MKPASRPPTDSEGKPFESLDSLFRAVIAVPKAEIDRREEEWKRLHGKSRAVQKVAERRAAGFCGACGKNPCECKRGARKQKAAKTLTPDLNRQS